MEVVERVMGFEPTKLYLGDPQIHDGLYSLACDIPQRYRRVSGELLNRNAHAPSSFARR